MRKNQPKQLLDRVADTPRRGLALGLGMSTAFTRQPIFDERLNMGGEFFPATCPGCLSKLSKSEQNGHTYKNIPGSVALLAEPPDVAFDRIADP